MLIVLVLGCALFTTCISFLILTFAKARWAWDAGAPVVFPSLVMGGLSLVSWLILADSLEASLHGSALNAVALIGAILAPLTAVAAVVFLGFLLWQLFKFIAWSAEKAAEVGRRHRAEAGLPPVVRRAQQEGQE